MQLRHRSQHRGCRHEIADLSFGNTGDSVDQRCDFRIRQIQFSLVDSRFRRLHRRLRANDTRLRRSRLRLCRRY